MAARNLKPKPRDHSAFDLLLSSSSTKDDDNGSVLVQGADVQWIPIDKIKTRSQPRRYFDEQKLRDLADSFTTQGFRGAINVRPIEKDTYELIAGERRFRAATLSGLTKVRCIIDHYTDENALRFALAENLLREDLSKLEEIEGILELIELEHGISKDEAVRLIQSEGHYRNQSRGNVSPSKRFVQIETILTHFGIKVETFRTKYAKGLRLPSDLKQAHLEGKLAFNAALELSKVKDEEGRAGLLRQVLTDRLSFRDIQLKVKKITSETSERKAPDNLPLHRVGYVFNRLKKAKRIKSLSLEQQTMLTKIQNLLETLLQEVEK